MLGLRRKSPAITEDGPFVDDCDAVADGNVLEVGVGGVFRLALDMDIFADLAVLIDDRTADRTPLADSQKRLVVLPPVSRRPLPRWDKNRLPSTRSC